VLKIGIVTGEYPPHQGGVGDYSREVALALAALGHEVHVIAHVDAHTDPSIHLHPIIRAWNFPSLHRIRQLAHSIPLDIVNLQYQAAAYQMTPPIHFLPWWLGLPSVVTFHDLLVPYLFPKAGGLRRAAVNLLARSASGVIVTNPADHAQLKHDPKIKHLTEIPIGSNIQPFALHTGKPNPDYRSRFGLKPNDTVIGYFGFLNASKGGATLLRAFAQLPPTNSYLLIIGGRTGTSDPTNTAYADEIDSLAAELGITDRIIRTGYLPQRETTEAFLACDLMAMPYVDGVSFRRGTFMACLAHGMPTITTEPIAPLPELRDGENVRLVERENPIALANTIQNLLENPGLQAKLAVGAAVLAGQFTWDKIAVHTASFFETVLQAVSHKDSPS
jgi:glycosyltransferase involved in cell wall biosynthesis